MNIKQQFGLTNETGLLTACDYWNSKEFSEMIDAGAEFNLFNEYVDLITQPLTESMFVGEEVECKNCDGKGYLEVLHGIKVSSIKSNKETHLDCKGTGKITKQPLLKGWELVDPGDYRIYFSSEFYFDTILKSVCNGFGQVVAKTLEELVYAFKNENLILEFND